MAHFEPVVLFFLLGVIAGLVRSDLKIPGVLYESLSIFLLLAIGLKGGVELARYSLLDVALPALVIVTDTCEPVAPVSTLEAMPVPSVERRDDIGRLVVAASGQAACHDRALMRARVHR